MSRRMNAAYLDQIGEDLPGPNEAITTTIWTVSDSGTCTVLTTTQYDY